MQRPEDVLGQYLKEAGIRHSDQRNSVLEVFLAVEKHLTARELYQLVKRKYPNIGYATVYRAMKVIADAGLADEVDFGEGVRRFEHKYGHDHHDHMICLKCGKFVEAVSSKIEKLQEELALKYGFSLLRHKMHLYGICRECGRKKTVRARKR